MARRPGTRIRPTPAAWYAGTAGEHRRVTVDELAEDDPRIPGPWTCPRRCELRYTHRVAHTQVRRGVEHHVGATFAKYPGGQHAEDCALHATGARDLLLREHPTHLRQAGDGLLFRIPAPAGHATGALIQRNQPAAAAAARDQASVLRTAKAIADLVDEHRADQRDDEQATFLERVAVRTHGRPVPWTAFAYGPDEGSLAALLKRWSGRKRPPRQHVFVRGIADGYVRNVGDQLVQARLYVDAVGTDQRRVYLWAPIGSAVEPSLRALVDGQRIAVLSDEIAFLDKTRSIRLRLQRSSQLHVYAPPFGQ